MVIALQTATSTAPATAQATATASAQATAPATAQAQATAQATATASAQATATASAPAQATASATAQAPPYVNTATVNRRSLCGGGRMSHMEYGLAPIEPDYKAERDLLARALLIKPMPTTQHLAAIAVAQRILKEIGNENT